MATAGSRSVSSQASRASQASRTRPPAGHYKPAADHKPDGRGRGGGQAIPPAERAVAVTLDKNTTVITLPDDLGTVRLPEPARLAYYAGLAALAAFGILDWPVLIVLAVGHVLAEQHNHRCLEDFGKALAEA